MKTCSGCGAPILSGDSCRYCGTATAQPQEEPKQKRKGRGLGKKPALFCTSLRLDKHVMEYFNAHHPYNKQAKMREILTEYVSQQTQGANK